LVNKAKLEEAVMRRRLDISVVVVASLLILCGGQVAVAQVDWQWGPLVVGHGPPGAWNEEGQRVGGVVFDGALYHLYAIGGDLWGGELVVGHWWSSDVAGPWVEDTNPVLEPGDPGEWDDFRIYTLAVHFDRSTFHMWYRGDGGVPGSPGPTYVGYASNDDGFGEWSKDYQNNPLPGLEPGDPGTWDEGGVSPHTVLFDGTAYHMWFTAGDGVGTWRIGHASSGDGLVWEKDPDPVFWPTEPWEGEHVYVPSVLPDRGAGLGMWYTGADTEAALGYAVSPDGIHWGKWRAWGDWPFNPVLLPIPPCNRVDFSAMLREGDTIYGWVSECEDIYLVSAPFDLVYFDFFETGDTTIWATTVGEVIIGP
jgi:hypothetical protein